jgi:hypothetical protein
MGNELTSIATFVDNKSVRVLKNLPCALSESVVSHPAGEGVRI